jgi:hypothetical protein
VTGVTHSAFIAGGAGKAGGKTAAKHLDEHWPEAKSFFGGLKSRGGQPGRRSVTVSAHRQFCENYSGARTRSGSDSGHVALVNPAFHAQAWQKARKHDGTPLALVSQQRHISRVGIGGKRFAVCIIGVIHHHNGPKIRRRCVHRVPGAKDDDGR